MDSLCLFTDTWYESDITGDYAMPPVELDAASAPSRSSFLESPRYLSLSLSIYLSLSSLSKFGVLFNRAFYLHSFYIYLFIFFPLNICFGKWIDVFLFLRRGTEKAIERSGYLTKESNILTP